LLLRKRQSSVIAYHQSIENGKYHRITAESQEMSEPLKEFLPVRSLRRLDF
jgi:hypothetical protein